MNKRTKIMAVLTTVLMLASIGGVAIADTGGSSSPAPGTELTAPDTDDVREGDRSGLDTAEAEEPEGEESSSESDGPGGHEDPAGNVDHEFEGEE